MMTDRQNVTQTLFSKRVLQNCHAPATPIQYPDVVQVVSALLHGNWQDFN